MEDSLLHYLCLLFSEENYQEAKQRGKKEVFFFLFLESFDFDGSTDLSCLDPHVFLSSAVTRNCGDNRIYIKIYVLEL
ncbi:hypothetical protein K2173_023400 [Erythroxylum novogranatense]|uniref:Maturase K n=1 Tax=Erythroxylum novogranatense TaxID=1862640 RepID=A0AAV8TZ11_9ROSI|nr:hypothetical protein K2173_023400 [Erythroxylum novogranatense]